MFTIDQIKATHAKVKSGADFPQYVQDMKQLGINSYEHFVNDGHVSYHGDDQFVLHADPKWPAMAIAPLSSTEALTARLKIHQQGDTDYLTFCREAAEAGVNKWVVDTQQMTCSYFDVAGNAMLVEVIPLPKTA